MPWRGPIHQPAASPDRGWLGGGETRRCPAAGCRLRPRRGIWHRRAISGGPAADGATTATSTAADHPARHPSGPASLSPAPSGGRWRPVSHRRPSRQRGDGPTDCRHRPPCGICRDTWQSGKCVCQEIGHQRGGGGFGQVVRVAVKWKPGERWSLERCSFSWNRKALVLTICYFGGHRNTFRVQVAQQYLMILNNKPK